MKKMPYLLIVIAFLMTSCTQTSKKSRIETFQLSSKVFENERTIRVYLPKEYDGKKKFKVLYLNDGQNLFGDNDSSSINEWKVDEIVDSLCNINLIEPIIVVGMDHMGVDRPNEYLPWEDKFFIPPTPNPEGQLYPNFLLDEVMPAIEKKYKVKKGPENTGLGGSSYGGLITAYTILHRPNTFGFAIIESPSLYVDDKHIITEINDSIWSWPTHVYVGMGTNEMGLEDCQEKNELNEIIVKYAMEFDSLVKVQAPKTQTFLFIDSCAIHNEKDWSRRLPHALEFALSIK